MWAPTLSQNSSTHFIKCWHLTGIWHVYNLLIEPEHFYLNLMTTLLEFCFSWHCHSNASPEVVINRGKPVNQAINNSLYSSKIFNILNQRRWRDLKTMWYVYLLMKIPVELLKCKSDHREFRHRFSLKMLMSDNWESESIHKLEQKYMSHFLRIR